MRTIPSPPKWTVNDYEHPSWCDIARCTPHVAHTPDDRPGGHHESSGTLWPIQSGEADVVVRVVRSNDWNRQGEDCGITQIEFVLGQHAWVTDGGAEVIDAGMSEEDALTVATILRHYASIAARDNGPGPSWLPVAELPQRSMK